MPWRDKQVASTTATSVTFDGSSGDVKVRGDSKEENFTLSLGIGNDQFQDISIPKRQLGDIIASLSAMSDAFDAAAAPAQPTPKGNPNSQTTDQTVTS